VRICNGRVLAAGTALAMVAGSALAGDTTCQVQEIAPGVKMRAANCPTLIGRPAALQNRVDTALQPPPGLYRYSDVEMRISPPRMAGPGIAGTPAGGAPIGARRP
jgi:hypothetical protein